MAMPIKYDPKQKLFMVRIKMGSPYRGKSKDKTEYIREITYNKPKTVRKEIAAIRQRINELRENSCTPFFGAYFTNELGRSQLIEACRKEDLEMKKIDPALHVTPRFITFKLTDQDNPATVFDELLLSIRSQVHGVVLNRISEVIARNKDLTPKTRAALIRMLDKTKSLNIINDPSIDADIEKMRARINASELTELRDEILTILDDTKDRAQALEILEPVIIRDEPEDQISRSAKLLPDDGSRVVLDIL